MSVVIAEVRVDVVVFVLVFLVAVVVSLRQYPARVEHSEPEGQPVEVSSDTGLINYNQKQISVTYKSQDTSSSPAYNTKLHHWYYTAYSAGRYRFHST